MGRERVEPVSLSALRGAAEGVESRPGSSPPSCAALVLAGPASCGSSGPGPLPGGRSPDLRWLPGGLWTGITQMASARLLRWRFIDYCYRRFHGHPEAVEEMSRETAKDRDAELRTTTGTDCRDGSRDGLI